VLDKAASSVTGQILIVGGGLVGSVLSLGLGNLGFNVILIDQKDLANPTLFEHSLALSITSYALLSQLGLASCLKDTTPIANILVSLQGSFSKTLLKNSDIDVPYLGYVISHHALLSTFYRLIHNHPHIVLMPNTTVVGVSQSPTYVVLGVVQAGITKTISGDFLLAADGTHSCIRTLLTLKAHTHDYDQTALLGKISTTQPHANRSFERFTKAGAIALLPEDPRHFQLIWTVSTREARALQSLSITALRQRLQYEFGYRAGIINTVTLATSHPLMSQFIEKPLIDRILLVGNAAQTLHPIAAQGFNLSLEKVCQIIELFALFKESYRSEAMLKAWANLPTAHHQWVYKGTHALAKYMNNFWGNIAITLGLTSLSLLPGTKALLLKYLLNR
jgi:2-octaprenyl-6-methoxyphenol hydroxylase